MCDEYEDEPRPVIGSAQAGAENEDVYPAAVLWLPDPTSESGWCDRWVKRPAKKQGRPMGYRR